MSDPHSDAAYDAPNDALPFMTFAGGKEGVNFLRFSPDGSRVASSVVLGAKAVVRDSNLQIWNIPAGKLEGESRLPERLTGLDIVPDWSILAVASPLHGIQSHTLDIHLHTLETWPTGRVIDSRPDVRAVAFFPDQKALLAGYADGHTRVIDATSGEQKAEILPARPGLHAESGRLWEVSTFAIAPHGMTVAIVASNTRGAVQIWTVSQTADELEWAGSLLDPEHAVFDVCFSPDGRWLAITDGVDNLRHDVVRVYDAASLQLEQVLAVPEDIPKALAFSGNGHYLAVAGAAGTVWLWNTQTWTRLGSIAAHVDAWDHRQGAPDWQIGALAWSATTGILATAGMDPLGTPVTNANEPYTGPIKYTIKLWEPKLLESVDHRADTESQR